LQLCYEFSKSLFVILIKHFYQTLAPLLIIMGSSITVNIYYANIFVDNRNIWL